MTDRDRDPAPLPVRVWRARVAAFRARPVPTLSAALAGFVVLAVGFAVVGQLVRNPPAAANTALVDVATTAEVADRLGHALEIVYSYDFDRLDENRRSARDVITPAFAVRFDELFAPARRLAQQQQTVVSATVTASAVQRIEGDRAVLVAFLDQQVTRAAPGADPQRLTAAGRLTVIGERVDGTWRITDVLNR